MSTWLNIFISKRQRQLKYCAHAYEQLGNERQAFNNYQQALHYDPNYEWVKMRLAQWLQRQPQSIETEADNNEDGRAITPCSLPTDTTALSFYLATLHQSFQKFEMTYNLHAVATASLI
jgi:tetratricopeptide (TPR) repeat protein